MELRQLRYFVALAEELHYGAAAKRLRISKPTLSQQIAVLERSLGAQLLDRRRSGVLLTAAGDVLLDQARSVLAQCDRIRLSVSTAASARSSLDLRVVHGLETVLEPQLLALQREDDLRVNLVLAGGVDAEEAVASGRADAAVVWVFSGTHTTLHVEPLGASAVWLAVPAEHRFAALEVVPVEKLRDEPITLFPRRLSPGVWDAFARHLLPQGAAPGQLLEELMALAPMSGMLDAVARGRAVAPFVKAVGEALSPEGVVFRPLDPPLECPIQLLTREPARRDLSRVATLLGEPARLGAALTSLES